MSTTTVNANGQERKTLAAQLDRLDQILDTLSDGLLPRLPTPSPLRPGPRGPAGCGAGPGPGCGQPTAP